MLGSHFQLIYEDHKFRYNPPTGMAEYANTYFETFVKETRLKQQVLMEN